MVYATGTSGSMYLSTKEVDFISSKRKRFSFSPIKAIVQATATVLASMTVISGLQLATVANVFTDVYAAPAIDDVTDDGSSKIRDTFEKAMAAEGFDPKNPNHVEEWLKKSAEKQEDRNSFSYIFKRVAVPGYINEAPDGYSVLGNRNGVSGCGELNHTGYGTVVYHNCDVPNFSGEFSQDLARLFIPHGAFGAEQQVAKPVNPYFGLPTSVLPGDKTVPVNPNERVYKYTGLELFGYNLNYTTYLGEWDYIKVMNEARVMSNFGTFDKLKFGGKTILDGAFAAAGNAIDGWKSGFAEGGPFKAIAGFYSGNFESAATQAANTILDTADLNVFEQKAWYRPDFGATTYGARQLNSNELAADALKEVNGLLNSYRPNTASIPADFPSSAAGPVKPLEAISKCEVVSGANGEMQQFGDTSNAPGISEVSCKQQGEAAKEQLLKKYPDSDTLKKSPGFKFSVDGARKQQSIAEWTSANAAFIDGMNRYGFACTLPTEGAAVDRRPGIDAWYSCLSSNWDKKYEETLTEEKKRENEKYSNAVVGNLSSVFASHYAANNQHENFNAAHNRFVCQDPLTGKDVRLSDGSLARVYNADGSLTGNCVSIRPPIQNGLLGNGYSSVEQRPDGNTSFDTRRTEFTPIESAFAVYVNTMSNFSLGVSKSVTQFSNSIIAVAFTPILETLGVNDLVVSLIESMRESLFFPLITLVVAASAVLIFINAVRSRAYASALVNFGYMVLAFVVSVVLLFKPAEVVKIVDQGPVMVENTILSALFNSEFSDDLCSTTGTASGEGQGGETIDGSQAFSPHYSIRTMMCENWRTFVFTPWVYGQWGTSFNNLYANGYNTETGTNAFTNKNVELVGDAAVNFGNGTVVHNWATYQLDATTVGTSTTVDMSERSGIVNKNFYRIVDLQMGPNGGEFSDSRFAKNWAKANGNTFVAGLLGPFVAMIGAVVIVGYTIAKLGLAVLSVLMLAFLPIMLLIGIHPTTGRSKLRSYVWTLLGVLVQRIVLTILLGLMFKFMFAATSIGGNYFMAAFLTAVIGIVFLMYRREILGMVRQYTEGNYGSFANGAFFNARNYVSAATPGVVRNFVNMKKAEAKGLTFGLAAGVLHGQTGSELGRSLKNIHGEYSQRELGNQFRQGLPVPQIASRVNKEVNRKLHDKFSSDEYRDSKLEIIEAATNYDRNSDGSVKQKYIADENGSLILTPAKDADGNILYHDESVPAVDYYLDENGVLQQKAKMTADGNPIMETVGAVKMEPATMPSRKHDNSVSDRELNSRKTRVAMSEINELRDSVHKLRDKRTVVIQKETEKILSERGFSKPVSEMNNTERAKYDSEKAKIHTELAQGRLSSEKLKKLDASIAKQTEQLNRFIEETVVKQGLRDKENRDADRKLAYAELSEQIKSARQQFRSGKNK